MLRLSLTALTCMRARRIFGGWLAWERTNPSARCWVGRKSESIRQA
jgi:hypothetical protein